MEDDQFCPYIQKNQGFDAYDIQCLIHVYNKFGNYYGKLSTTNINELRLSGQQTIELHIASHFENHPCVISNELAGFLKQPIGSIFTPKQVREMVIRYCFDQQLIIMDGKLLMILKW